VSAASPAPADGDRFGLLAGFAAIYLIWGSTYLAIRFAVETLPPFLMTGVRFLMAGTLMYGWARLRGLGRPSRSHWAAAALVGTLMLLFGVGGVSWAEQWVPSGAAALIVAVGPLWMVMIDWLFFGGVRPGARVVAGILLGFAGVVLLVGPEELAGAGRIDLVGTGVILLGTLTWSFGSLYSRGPSLPSSPILATGMEMLMGAFVLLAVGTAAGEWAALDVAAVSLRSLLSVGYLAVFGSIIALSAYLWLLKVTTPARTLAATAVITSGVLVIITRREVRRAPAAEFEHA
jgi:drug/metabolite transporter (DMT)-like permease